MPSRPTLAQLADALARGTTTSRTLTEAALGAIETHRKAGGAAFVHVDASAALAAADASDAARRAGYCPSPLAGIPVSVKDLFDVAGQVTRAGAVVLPDTPAATDAEAVARLRRAGAVLIGRTNMSEFAFSGLGVNPHYGTPRSPFDEARVAGGSTSGGGLSVALGMASAALGTDTGGSLRIPAAFCGIVGFKPSADRVSSRGAIPLSTTLDSIGALAPSVACCATLDAVLSGQTLDTAPLPVAGLRLFVTRDYVCDGIDDAVGAAFEAALSRLSAAGARIVEFDFPELRTLPEVNAKGGFTAAESWYWHRDLLRSRGGEYDPIVARRIARGEAISAADYLELLDARAHLQARAAEKLRGSDAWLMPSVAIRAPRLDELADADDFLRINGLVLRNTTVLNFLDGAACSVPCAAGIGLSVGGLYGSDAKVLSVAAGVERALADAAH
ncbi:amidase [Chitinasiproducens palmae]|uniref:Aspartyl-tRNA(Asn)/glutamyl-tRNA(Gln) amidotransferase subunit A n=1 Tax=Chitinasiproducens palmae TaxID=1770053 RepID=A0A1H2PS87_9BURK|nr:amidase [Chitinasiproducens palmae]SDV49008.1 aspartyl-tRNA(Asn)/glutamyl-tRNA(Gln) amidotransferase subunit A [Chitinasiproducens palmae]